SGRPHQGESIKQPACGAAPRTTTSSENEPPMDPLLAAVLTLVGVVVLFVLFVLASGGFARFGLALQAFRRTLGGAGFAAKGHLPLNPPPPEPPTPPKPSGEPLRVLTVLQRESRLVDFLMEDLGGADDDQVAAAVRDIQPKAQASLKK